MALVAITGPHKLAFFAFRVPSIRVEAKSPIYHPIHGKPGSGAAAGGECGC